MAVTYIFESTDKTIGFFCVHNDKISIKEAKSPSFWQKRVCENVPHPKRMKSFPAVKIGRLGIHGDYQSLGFGSAILDFIKIFFLEKNKTGCKFITVDAYNKENVLSFYEKNGFKYLTDEKQDADKNGIIKTRLMFYDLNRLITS
ncbi:MAG TPA: GNAT family N-acetyltransferase [Spirochaetota bacterium]|nr:GNAT family N-acetyltransferase [Spirochaetota bacterium]